MPTITTTTIIAITIYTDTTTSIIIITILCKNLILTSEICPTSSRPLDGWLLPDPRPPRRTSASPYHNTSVCLCSCA